MAMISLTKKYDLFVCLKDGYWQSVRTFQQHEQFLEGMLLKEIKSTGGHFLFMKLFL